MIRVLTLILAVFGVYSDAFAQLLPKGYGAYTLGYRKYSTSAKYYDSTGAEHNEGQKLNVDFSSSSMASGKVGADLQKLYTEVKKFDTQGTSNSVADEMDFGKITGDVTTNIDAKFIGMGYGFTENVTVFLGVPYVSAKIDTNLSYDGVNNASAIKARIGNLVYKEIQDGLTKASTISADSVRSSLQDDKGYQSIDHWEYNGLGDVALGAQTEVKGQGHFRLFTLGLKAQLELATGHQDDPDNLIDVPIGRGYPALTLGADSKMRIRYLTLGLKNSFTQGMESRVTRRVPDGEDKLVGADRKFAVDWTPGRDVLTVGYVGLGVGLFSTTLSYGMKRHYADKYRGSVEGNYALLAEGTDESQSFGEVGVSVNTINAYMRRKLSFPLVVALVGHQTLSGVNVSKDQYIELSVMSFFTTSESPKAAEAKKERDHPVAGPTKRAAH